MADKGKGSFGAQVAAVVLILAICVLCFPMPGGGLLITRLSGTDYVPEGETPRAAPIVSFPPVAMPPPVETPKSPPRFSLTLDILPQAGAPEVMGDPLDPLWRPAAPAHPDWVEVSYQEKTVWIDTRSGMIWGPRLDVDITGMEKEDLDLARSFCEKETPVGAWAFPTAAEFDIAKVNGILKNDTGAKHKWLTWQEVSGLVIPSVRGYVPASRREKYSLRCIARTPTAPENGYLATDNETTLKAMAE